jgi:hypothetical protein
MALSIAAWARCRSARRMARKARSAERSTSRAESRAALAATRTSSIAATSTASAALAIVSAATLVCSTLVRATLRTALPLARIAATGCVLPALTTSVNARHASFVAEDAAAARPRGAMAPAPLLRAFTIFLTLVTGTPRLRAFALVLAGATMEIPGMRN